jgi:crotonobetainyl-CoA:carnitine CoA-transferase CaiB-like acyl-CoA transferase
VICDHVVGEIAVGAILAAVVKRNAGSGGSSLEIPMFETMAAFVLQEHLGDQRLVDPHDKPLRTADGWIAVTINTDPQVRAFLNAVGRDQLLEDPLAPVQ